MQKSLEDFEILYLDPSNNNTVAVTCRYEGYRSVMH
jgi:hypothetical protein